MNGLRSSVRLIGGIRIHIGEAGSGAPLLLVHGLGGSQMWTKVITLLSERFRVIVPDLPGFGNSDAPPAPFITEDYAEFLPSLLDDLGIDTINIGGISYGGEISALFSGRYPRRVRRLVLISSTGLSGPGWITRNDIRWSVFSGFARQVLLRSKMVLAISGSNSFYDLRNRPADFVENFHRQMQKEERRETWLQCVRNVSSTRNNFPATLRNIASPALILWGENDRVVPVKYASLFRDYIRGAKMRIFSGCGHSVPLEKPEEMCREMREFICGTQL